ncbi:hypothetical protein Ae168Ps1_6061c [Pseudonocardia sp. Ae168_Ps1]|uniref:relaxase/mobilization nuclease domain-containing protein n=1 Tax=unclassified Pseudonocardia TaxID=2619320 RepID=UPI00094B2DC3|nr:MULTISPECIES: hypothetical protein [unclassified Pseudonocardia]OLL70596.1 hypothetical protein Ae168Ps1_6061c [Pseudonocardia sp. Ae168_Ps1]
MIAKISRGWRLSGLVYYLMGPGRANEHVDQRVVAAWDGCVEVHQPSLRADGSFDVSGVVAELSDPAVAAGVSLRPQAGGERRPKQGPVWHCSLRCAPEDSELSDEQWSEVVEDLMDRTGIARRGDLDGCRWVAIRHAGDHVHVAAVLVGQVSGRRVSPSFDRRRARETCQVWEERLELTRTAAADRSSVSGPSRAELEKATRLGWEGPSRVWLRRQVRAAAVQARDAEGFVSVLSGLGVSVRPRYAAAGDRASGMVGYAVSVPGDKNVEGRSVWFSGRRLAADLSLPNLRARWASAVAGSGYGQSAAAVEGRTAVGSPVRVSEGRVSSERRAAAVAGAVSAMGQATAALSAARSSSGELPDGAGDGVAHAVGDMLAAVGVVTAVQDPEGRVVGAAGDVFDRATRVPGRVLPLRWSPVAAGLRSAAWELASVRGLGASGEADAGRLIVAVAAVVAEVAALREAQQRPAQAAAARRGCVVLAAVPASADAAAVSVARSSVLVQDRQDLSRPVGPVSPLRSASWGRGGEPPGRSPGLRG